MKFPVVILLALGLVLCQGTALAEEFTPCTDRHLNTQLESQLNCTRGLTVLTVSPLYLEIKGVIESAHVRVQELLKELAAATDAAQAEDLVRRIERIEFEQRVCILKVQLKYARQAGLNDLAATLQLRLTELLAQDVQLAGLTGSR